MSQKLDNKRRNLRRSPELTYNDFKKSHCKMVALFKYRIAYLGGSIILEKSSLFY